MAESASYLKYDEGLVLHNGLPVKWVTGAWGQWEDFDIIIERYDSNSDYAGYSVSSITSTAAASANKYGYEISAIDGDIKMYTSRAKTGEFITKSGAQYVVTASSPKLPAEYNSSSGETVRILGCLYPNSAKAGNHYYMGVKFSGDGCPSVPDLTNHGPANGWSVVHKLKLAPGVGSLSRSFNASNYSAIKNVTIPGSMKSSGYYMGINAYDAPYGKSKVGVRLFENWNAPNFDFVVPFDAGLSYTAFSNMTTANMSAHNMKVNNWGSTGFDELTDINVGYQCVLNNTPKAENISAMQFYSLTNVSGKNFVQTGGSYNALNNCSISGFTGLGSIYLTASNLEDVDSSYIGCNSGSNTLKRAKATNISTHGNTGCSFRFDNCSGTWNPPSNSAGMSGQSFSITGNNLSGFSGVTAGQVTLSGVNTKNINVLQNFAANDSNVSGITAGQGMTFEHASAYNCSSISGGFTGSVSSLLVNCNHTGYSKQLYLSDHSSAINCTVNASINARGASYLSGCSSRYIYVYDGGTATKCSAEYTIGLSNVNINGTFDNTAQSVSLSSSTAQNISARFDGLYDTYLNNVSGFQLAGSGISAYNSKFTNISASNSIISGISGVTALYNSGDNRTSQLHDISGQIKVYVQEGNSANLHNVEFADVLTSASFINCNYPGNIATSSFNASGCKLSGTYILCDKGWNRYAPISNLYACKLENPTFILSGFYDNGIAFYPGNSAFSTTGRIGFSAVSADHGISDYTRAPHLGCVLSAMQYGQIGGNYWPFTATLSGIYTLSAYDYGEMIYVPSGTVIDLSHADFDLSVYSGDRRIWVDNWSNLGGTLILPSAYSGKIIITGSQGLNYVTVQWA